MTKTKHALLMSGLALLLCVSMLVGSTYAWFTDSVTSTGNIIKSGTLDVTMHWADASKAVPASDSAEWTDASQGPIFNYDKWEPGYVDAKHVKISNEGTLALKYQLRVVANGTVSKLGDVIDVYYFDTAKQLTRGDVTGGTKLGTLNEIFGTDKNLSNAVYGDLLENQDKTVTLAFKMQESAGNEYQNLTVGTDFSVELTAIQLTYEKDSFDEFYDEDALTAKVPAAFVTELEDKNINATLGLGGATESITLDTAYKFQPTQSFAELEMSEYKYYIADFVVSADKDVPEGSIALAGYYKEWCQHINDNWVAIVNDGLDIAAGTQIHLVEALGAAVHYKDICQYGNDGIGFLCGAKDLTGENGGTTLTVKLCLFETTADPNGSSASYDIVDGAEPIVIGEFKYTFPETEDNGPVVKNFDSLKAALNNGEKKIAIAGTIELSEGLAASDVTFTGVGGNATINFNGYNIGGTGSITYKGLNLNTVALPGSAGERAGWHGGIDYNGHAVANYIDCNITGVFTTYSNIINANGTTFNYYVQDGEEYYGLWMYDTGVVNAEDCTFMYGDRAIKIFSEGPSDFELNIKGGQVVATDTYSVNKSIINIDATALNSAKISVEGLTIDGKLATAEKHNAGGNAKVTVDWN